MRMLKALIALSAMTIITSCANRSVMESEAQATVVTYYDDLRVGLSREEQNLYWTEKRAKRFKAMVYRISNRTGVDQSREARRMMDVATFQARCEELSFMDANTSGFFVKKVSLIYQVNPTCADWLDGSQRQVELKYSNKSDQWLIDQVHDWE